MAASLREAHTQQLPNLISDASTSFMIELINPPSLCPTVAQTLSDSPKPWASRLSTLLLFTFPVVVWTRLPPQSPIDDAQESRRRHFLTPRSQFSPRRLQQLSPVTIHLRWPQAARLTGPKQQNQDLSTLWEPVCLCCFYCLLLNIFHFYYFYCFHCFAAEGEELRYESRWSWSLLFLHWYRMKLVEPP